MFILGRRRFMSAMAALVPSLAFRRSASARYIPAALAGPAGLQCWRCKSVARRTVFTTYCPNHDCFVCHNVWMTRRQFREAARKDPKMITWRVDLKRDMVERPERYYTGQLAEYGLKPPMGMTDNGMRLVGTPYRIETVYGVPRGRAVPL